MKIFGYEISKATNAADQKRPAGADIQRRITKPQAQVIRIKTDQARYKIALITAEAIINPNRFQLYQVYKQIELDAHLTAAVQQRKNLTLSRKFKVVDKGHNENEQLTQLLQKKWFYDFIDMALDSLFYGYSLIQFGDLIKDEFANVELVPRIYVKPEFHLVVDNTAALVGTDYTSGQYRDWCIGVGKERDLGLYMKAAPLIIWKQGAMGAWAEYQELFGTPIRIGRTNVRDESTRGNMEEMLKMMGQASYGIFDLNDKLELIETTKADAFQVYNEMIARCNTEISKLILGQTGTMDEKSFVGSAEVMERVLSNYAEQDENFIQGVLNYQLIPLLERHGIMFNGCTICAEDDEDLPLAEAIKIDDVLLKYYDIDPKEIEESYGRKVTKKVEPKINTPGQIKNELDELYL